MLSIPTLLAGFLAFFSAVYSAPASIDEKPQHSVDSLSGYQIVPIQWDLPIKPDDPSGKKVTVTGTIQDAITKMESGYLGWNATFHAQLTATNLSTSTSANAAREWPETFKCKIVAGTADLVQVQKGIKYLRGVSGTAKNGPGPGNCGRVSCSWGAAIFWCNDNPYEKEVEWNTIADGAQYILDRCLYGSRAKGQANFVEKWGVVVKNSPC